MGVRGDALPSGAVAWPAASEASSPLAVRAPLNEEGRASLKLGEGREWVVSCEGPETWCPAVLVDRSRENRELRLPMFVAATLTATVTVEHVPLPREVSVQGWIDRGPGGVLEYSTRAGLRDGVLSVRLPGLPQDLRIAAPGFAPVYRWETQPAKGVFHLGTLKFVAGGSIGGFVVDTDGGLPLPHARAALAVPGEPASPRDAEGLQRMQSVAETDVHGFFHFTGLRPGRYVLLLTSDHHAPRRDEVEVVADAETLLPRLELGRYPLLDVAVEPNVDPEGRPWAVEARALEGGEERRGVTQDGLVTFRGLAPGRYRFMVRSVDEERSYMAVEERAVQQSEVISLSLPLIRVKGEVRLDDRPLPAELRLSTGAGESVRLTADEYGRFQGWIRRPSRSWIEIVVRAEEQGIDRTIEITGADVNGDPLELELTLEDRRLEGVVVDEEGSAVADARVTARLGDQAATADSRADGSFEIRGLSAATYLVDAYTETAVSRPVAVDVKLAESAQSRLVVLRRRLLRGEVLASDGQPVPSARVRFTIPASSPLYLDERTDLEGRFSLRVPAAATQAVVKVLAPSQVLWSGCVDLPEEPGEVTLRLPALPGGEAHIEVQGDDALPPPRDGELVLITSDGGILSYYEQAEWQSQNGGRTEALAGGATLDRLPRLASGAYALLWSMMPEPMLATQVCNGVALAGLEWKQLDNGGVAAMTFDARPHQEAELGASRASRW